MSLSVTQKLPAPKRSVDSSPKNKFDAVEKTLRYTTARGRCGIDWKPDKRLQSSRTTPRGWKINPDGAPGLIRSAPIQSTRPLLDIESTDSDGSRPAVAQNPNCFNLGLHSLMLLGRPQRSAEAHVFEVPSASEAPAVDRVYRPIEVGDEPCAV